MYDQSRLLVDLLVSRALFRGIAILALLAILPKLTSAQDFTYTTISVPGSFSTTPAGINDHGQIVGLCSIDCASPDTVLML